jgi:diguanylate cyclase (GGDEF)-like protein
MSESRTHKPKAQSAPDRLLEDNWEARQLRRTSRRVLKVEAAGAALFGAVSVALLVATHALAGLHLPLAVCLVLAYTIVARIEFPIGAGTVVPTQLVLIPMLVVLPPGAVPLLVAVSLVITTSIDYLLGRVPARRIVSALPDAWHAVGPALVLLIAGSPAIGFAQLPLMTGAFAACCVVDLVSSLARVRLSGLVTDVRAQLGVIVSVWAVDASLAPLGLLAAVSTKRGDAAILYVMPLGFLLWLLARDRSERIHQAHRRLKLVEQERARLQSAVRRLGDAFAAKLELDGLLEILLNGCVEALDANAGRLALSGVPTFQALESGAEDALLALANSAELPPSAREPLVSGDAERFTVSFPLTIDAGTHKVSGALSFARSERTFEPDEIGLISQLISKAELAAAEILGHHALREQAVTDALTGLGNRRKLTADLASTLERATTDTPCLLLLFDLDGFKDYNDTFGHLAGDALLARLASKLRDAVAGDGDAYRLGGDEFCARLELDGRAPDYFIARAAGALTETGQHFAICASLGVVLLPHEADSPDHALQLADQRMYANKRGRRSGARDQARDVLLSTMRAKQPNLDEHSSQVADLAVRVGRQLGLSGESLDEIARAAELHDVGKVGIPDAILNKPEALDAAEWQFMHQHTILGERILHAAPALRPVARLVRASHERWDGRGYPDGLRGEQIPLGARIVAVCDAYEAMTADRPYRKARPHAAACEELRGAAGLQFDPLVVEAFLSAIETAADEYERNAVEDAAAHVRTLLAQA